MKVAAQTLREASCSARAAFFATASALSLALGCTNPVHVRLSSSFDGYVTGAAAATTPAPTPPQDVFQWPSAYFSSTVVNGAGGVGWVRIAPKPTLVDVDVRHWAMYGYTEALTTAPAASLRGSVKVRLHGYGVFLLGLQTVNAQSFLGGFLGGIQISVAPLTSANGVIDAVNPFKRARIQDNYPLGTAGTIRAYAPGSQITLRYSIDQSSRTIVFGADAAGSVSQTVQYPAVEDGVDNTPINRLLLSVWLQRIEPNTELFMDDILVEEY